MPGTNNIHRSPLRYPGGKNCIFAFMKSLLEENDMVGTNYAEPYAGGAGLALRLLMENLVNDIYINDYDVSIYAFWDAVLNHPDELCAWIETVPVNIKTWEHYKQVQKNRADVDYLELAKSTFFLNRTNVSGVISGGPIGGMNQAGKYKIDVRFNKKDLIRRIQNVAAFSDRIHLSNRDGIEFIGDIEGQIDNLFIYLDPPYYKKGAFLYLNAFNDEAHTALSEEVARLKSRWLVSYDYQNFILGLYPDKRKLLYQLSQCTSNRIGDEVLIFDDRLMFENAQHELNSPQVL